MHLGVRPQLATGMMIMAVLPSLILASCGGGGADGVSPSAVSSEPTTVEPSPTQADRPEPVSSVKQGGTYWAVYISVANSANNADVKLAEGSLQALGIKHGWSAGDISCDKGAAAALGVPDGSYAVAVYFKSEAEANAFAQMLPTPIVGVVQVKTYCAD